MLVLSLATKFRAQESPRSPEFRLSIFEPMGSTSSRPSLENQGSKPETYFPGKPTAANPGDKPSKFMSHEVIITPPPPTCLPARYCSLFGLLFFLG